MGDRTDKTTERVEDGDGLDSSREELAIQWVVDSALMGLETLRGARLQIGRGDDCHLRIEHASVSRQHAELRRQGPIYALHDLGSTNGTWVNGVRVDHTAISAGDVLRFGECIGIVVGLDAKVATRTFGSLAPGLWGGPTLARALANAKAGAGSDLPVIVVGETGVGKERIARALHHFSGRAGRFNAVNCSAVPGALAEAELFGHQRGAFTGAHAARSGHFQAAHGGTLFLDEIEELPLDVQAKLLRALEAREVVPLGGTDAIPVDVRIIAAAHERLEVLVASKKFRADLFARLAGFVVEIPPLRKRREEVAGLCFELVRKHSTGPAPSFAPALLEWLCLREWPGNVRELDILIRKLLALHASEPTWRLSFAQAITGTDARSEASVPPAQGRFRDRQENDLHRLQRALEGTSGNLKAAAAAIGISRRRAYRVLQAGRSEAKREDEELQ